MIKKIRRRIKQYVVNFLIESIVDNYKNDGKIKQILRGKL